MSLLESALLGFETVEVLDLFEKLVLILLLLVQLDYFELALLVVLVVAVVELEVVAKPAVVEPVVLFVAPSVVFEVAVVTVTEQGFDIELVVEPEVDIELVVEVEFAAVAEVALEAAKIEK